MGKKVFISHAAVDEQIVSLFVDHILHNGSGVSLEDIVYTSREDSGVVNGEDIPLTIKNGIKQCALFFMMVSEGYRKSEVCLNEMGAAWIIDDLPKKIILLPNVDFEQIGWLMSLKKGTKLTDTSGLDALHDQISEILSTKVQTATWNRCKQTFLQQIQEQNNNVHDLIPVDVVYQEDDDDEMDLLDIRERFDEYNHASIEIINLLSRELSDFNEQLNTPTEKLNKAAANPQNYTTLQLRAILYKCSSIMNKLSEIYEKNVPLLRDNFDLFMEYASKINCYPVSDENKANNRKACQVMIDNMIGVKDETTKFKTTLGGISGDLDKTLKKAKNRLILANDQLIEALSFCVSRATDYMLSFE